MTAKEFADKLNLEILSIPTPNKEVDGAYAGDLLSWVMGRAHENCVWATIMTNLNVIAVASLLSVSSVVICEDSEISEDIIAVAKEKSVNLFRTKLPMYEFCVEASKVI